MKKLTKMTMKVLSMCMVLCMLIGALPVGATLKPSATYAYQLDAFEDFEDVELGTIVDSKDWKQFGNTLMTTTDTKKYPHISSVVDPTNENNKVARLAGTFSAHIGGRASHEWHPIAYSFKLYFPVANKNLNARVWVGSQWFDVFATAGAGNTAKFNFWDKASFNLKYPEDYADPSLAGTDYIVPQEKWIDVTLFMEDMGNTTGDFRFKVFVDGVCMMPETNLSFSTYGATYNNNSGMRYYWFQGDSTQVLLDDVEIRSEADRQAVDHPSYSTKILNTAPTAAITSGHEGTGVSVENKELNIEFSGATAEGVWPPEGCYSTGATPGNIGNGMGLTTNRVMDTTTYSNNITVKAGTNVLTEGVHYTLSWNDTKNLKINFVNNLYGNKEYTVSINENVKNLLGYSIEPCELSFVTEVVEGEAEPPEVGLSTANNGKRFLPGEEISFEATALSANDIEKVEFYASEIDGKCELPAPYATVTEAPYTATVSFAEEGTYEVYAKATDSEGLFDFSNKIRVLVKEEANVDIDVIPGNDFVLYKIGDQTLEAKATSPDGEALSAVTLTLDGKPVANPYKGALEVGNHTLEATVLDSRGTSYSKTVNFEYRPEYFVAAPQYYNFNNGGADWLEKSSWYSEWGGEKEDTYESVDAEHGDSLTYTAGNGVSAKQYRMENQYIAEVMQYEFEFYLEDLDAQKVNFGQLGNASTGVEVGGGRLRSKANTSITYGYVEAKKWYKATTLVDWIRGKAIVTVGDMQAITYFTPKGEGHDRMYLDFFYVNGWAEAGKKMYIDNLVVNRSVIAPVISEVKNINADDTTVSGAYVTENTKGFDVAFGNHVYGNSMTDKIKLYQGETEIPVTLTFPSTSLSGRDGTLYKSVKVTPANSGFKFETGKVYSLKFLPGLKSHQKSFASMVFSGYGATSAMTYEFTKTATASDIVYEKTAIYEGSKVVNSMGEIEGSKVKFGLTAQSFNAEADNEVLLIIAGYDENGALNAISAKTVTVGTAMDTYYTDEIDVAFSTSVKGFIWDDMAGLEPIGLGVGF